MEIRATAVAVELSCLQKQGLLVRWERGFEILGKHGPWFCGAVGKEVCGEYEYGLYLTRFLGERETSLWNEH